MDVGQRLPVDVADDEASVGLRGVHGGGNGLCAALVPFSARRGGICWVDESVACKYCRSLGAAVAVLIGELWAAQVHAADYDVGPIHIA